MLTLQVIPRTWSWKDKHKTRLVHKQNAAGYIEVGSADGVVIAEIHAKREADTYFFAEKFIGRLVAWFLPDLAAINMQFRDAAGQTATRKKKKRSRR